MDELAEVAAELYSSPLKEFVTERATRAGAAVDRELAERIRALRKPSIAAWIVNVFARERTDRLAQALQLAEELREAQADLDAATLAGLGRQRRALTAQLAREAVSLAQDRGERVSASTSQAVQQTLSAAFFDPVAAAAVASGRLVRELQPSGEYAAALEEIVGGGRPEQRSWPAPRRPDEVQARRVRREAERAVIAAERELSRAQRGRQETETEQRELTERVRRLDARAAELRAELARIGEESEKAAALVDDLSGRQIDAAARVAAAEKELADARAAVEQLGRVAEGPTARG
jgi:chromosome segregation ATPase